MCQCTSGHATCRVWIGEYQSGPSTLTTVEFWEGAVVTQLNDQFAGRVKSASIVATTTSEDTSTTRKGRLILRNSDQDTITDFSVYGDGTDGTVTASDKQIGGGDASSYVCQYLG